MTNDELQKKISEIIDGSVDDWATRDRRGRIQVHVSTIADILVKAGLKFDASISHTATFDLLQQNRINELEKRIAEAERRAEVAERALLTACVNLIKDKEDNVNTELLARVVYTKYLRKAEKELSEGRKDENI